jgi:hypothetical protein
VYTIVDSDDADFKVYKFSNEEILLWRLFVWDKLKLPSFGGKIIEFGNTKH